MTAPQDPVVRDITEYINRSAGQHKRRISEGTESAVRLLRLPVYDSMTPDPYLLDRSRDAGDVQMVSGTGGTPPKGRLHYVNTDDMPEAQPVEFAGPEPLTLGDWLIVAIVLGVVLLAVFREPIAHWLLRVTA